LKRHRAFSFRYGLAYALCSLFSPPRTSATSTGSLESMSRFFRIFLSLPRVHRLVAGRCVLFRFPRLQPPTHDFFLHCLNESHWSACSQSALVPPYLCVQTFCPGARPVRPQDVRSPALSFLDQVFRSDGDAQVFPPGPLKESGADSV